MGDKDDKYVARPVEMPLDDEFFERPFFAYGIFKKGQLAYSRISDFVENVEPDDVHREMHIRDGVPVIKNEYSSRISRGEKIHFFDDGKYEAYEIISNTQLGNVYEWDTIDIGRETFNVLVTKKFKGTFLNVDKNNNYQDYYDGKEDIFFFKASCFIKKELESMTYDDNTIFKIQMYYMLLWSAIERYCVLKYDVCDNQSGYLWDLSQDEIFQDALDFVNPKDRKAITSAKNATNSYFNKAKPNFIVNFYYTIRCNVAHRGKEEDNNFDALIDSLWDTLRIFEYIIEKTFGKKISCDDE